MASEVIKGNDSCSIMKIGQPKVKAASQDLNKIEIFGDPLKEVRKSENVWNVKEVSSRVEIQPQIKIGGLK